MPARAKVLIVDDHPLVREGLAARVSAQRDMEVCGEAADVDEALALVAKTKPALVIVDLALKRGHGLDLIERLRASGMHMRILVVSAYEEALFAQRALRAGAHGYVNKQEAQESVLVAIRAVLAGERYLSAEMTRRLLDEAIEPERERHGVESLTNREIEVFDLIGRGNTTRAIARRLDLSIHTVESHRENIRRKLGLSNGAELARRATEWVLERR
jgi:DNA-binding NarL/FixJ family response regulator